MVRKAILLAALSIVAVWLAMWSGAWLMGRVVTTGSQRTWPMGLGTLSEVPGRHPVTKMSSGAARLIALAAPLGIDLAPRRMGDPPAEARPLAFVRGQLTKWAGEQVLIPTPEIEPVPGEAGEYLAGRAADLTAIQTLLLSGEPVVWDENVYDPLGPLPNHIGTIQLCRVLVGRSLDRARAGDRGAWDDLRAAWHLMRPLADRNELVATILLLGGVRMIDAAARKLPAPAPEWLQELHAFDFRRAAIATIQVEAWRIAERVYGETTIDAPETAAGRLRRGAVDFVMGPYTRASAADIADSVRRRAAEIAAMRACSLDPEVFARRHPPSGWNVTALQISTPNIDTVLRRVLRWTPQREATARALALREGAPPNRQSACADGEWVYADDGRSFRFSREIADGSPFPIPLAFGL
ncbi:MAG TPA: hypothetical protein VNA04_02045 [Thermoanaerobaculia bacterium]|nr:hypothetical protein [Thermoanaerobaculia bacterium]